MYGESYNEAGSSSEARYDQGIQQFESPPTPGRRVTRARARGSFKLNLF